MIAEKKELKRLKKKIYTKQVELFKKIEDNQITVYNDIKIKTNVDEINILLEIFDNKLFNYQQLSDQFWK